ncbi:MAG: elongation factor G, partial [Candidatus Marinimicrobia bacterium]|nr:elongation factor G [Candidatus Neomarinimicrobiota bacterium]
MKDYKTSDLRNCVLVGHSACGKTILNDAMLFASGQITRIGSIEEGSTVSDYYSEEIERQISIRSSLTYVEWKDKKI